jgi:hypothetical protein
MFEYWSVFILAFLGFIGLGLLIYLLGNRKTRAEDRKGDTYTCGEPFPATGVPSDSFYEAVIKNLRIDDIRRLHSGRLSEYLLWLVVGTVAVIIMVVFI